MKFIHLFICLTFFSIVTNGQIISKADMKKSIFHSLGISFQKFENLNKRVAAYPQFEQSKNSMGTFQFGRFDERNRLIRILSIEGGKQPKRQT